MRTVAHRVLRAVWLLATMWALAGCSLETRLGGDEGHGATFTLSTRVTDPQADPDDPDNKIETLRVMAFKRQNGALRTNKKYNVALHDNITHTIPTGVYDFVFIANEPASSTPRLDGITTRAGLNSVAFPAESFASDVLIPQLQEVKNVEVRIEDGEAGVKIDNGKMMTSWSLELVRMAARIDVTLTSKVDMAPYFQGVRLSKIPSAVALFPDAYVGGAAITRNIQREYKLTDTSPAYFADPETSLAEGVAWEKRVVRLVVPANEHGDKTDPENAIVMTLLMGDRHNPVATMGADDDKQRHLLGRNTWLQCRGEISTPFTLNLTPTDWSEAIVNGNINTTRILNVGEIAPDFVFEQAGDRLEVSFWSNQPAAQLKAGDWSTYFDAAVTYDSATGVGSVLFTLKTLPSADQKVILQVGKRGVVGVWLEREITLRVKQQ